MYVKEITFEDFDGNTQKEKHYFNLTEAEVIEWVTTNGDYSLDAVLAKMVEKKRGKDIIDAFKDLIYRSYGEKSLDGKRFIKTDEVRKQFMESNAYSVLFMELVTDASAASDFISGIMPKKIKGEIDRILKENPEGIPDSVKDYLLPENK